MIITGQGWSKQETENSRTFIEFHVQRDRRYHFAPEEGAVASISGFRADSTIICLASNKASYHRNSSWYDGPIGKFENLDPITDIEGLACTALNEAVMAGFRLQPQEEATDQGTGSLLWAAWRSGVRDGLQANGDWWKHQSLFTYRLEAFCLALAGQPVPQRPWGIEQPDQEAWNLGQAARTAAETNAV